MSLFDLIFKPKEKEKANHATEYFKTLTAYHPHFTTWYGSIYESDLVRAAIDARARHISKLKVEIHGAGKPKLQTRLKLQPNSWQTWSQFMYRASTILDMQNTLVICPVYDTYMEVVGYYPILPTRCEVIEYENEPWLRFKFKDGTYASDKYSNCVVLTKFQYESDFFGSTNHALEPTMKLIHVQNQGIEEAVKNGATFRFMARVNNFSLPSDLKNEAKRFNENNLRTDEDGGLLLFPNTYSDIKQIDSKPYTVSDAENNNIRTSVYNYFAVNEDILQSKAYGDNWAAFYESVIEQFAISFSEAMTKTIFTEKERQQGSFVMATSNRLQYMSTADKLNVSSQMADRGILSINEIRDIWNLAPIEGGDTRIIRGEYYKANTKLEEIDNADQEG